MSPGGHLVTTVIACAGTASLTGSWAATAAVAAGGFLIDIDHAVDYVLLDWPQGSGVEVTLDAFYGDAGVGRQTTAKWATTTSPGRRRPAAASRPPT